jgi:hypothetical protein
LNQTLIRSVLSLSALLIVAGATVSCAGSSASRAVADQNRTLSMSDIERCAAQIVTDTTKDPWFVRFQAQEQDRNVRIGVLLQSYRNRIENDRMWESKKRDFFAYLEEYFLSAGVTFRQDLDPGLPNYTQGIEQFDMQDSDDRYDQKTGKVTTGAARKAVLGLQIELSMEEIGRQREFVLRSRLIDGETKETLVSKSSRVTKGS